MLWYVSNPASVSSTYDFKTGEHIVSDSVLAIFLVLALQNIKGSSSTKSKEVSEGTCISMEVNTKNAFPLAIIIWRNYLSKGKGVKCTNNR